MSLTIVIAGLAFAVVAVGAAIFALLTQSRNPSAKYYASDEETTAADRLLRHRGG